jgi:hypothetical protein
MSLRSGVCDLNDERRAWLAVRTVLADDEIQAHV